jgi:hypothetical protein
MNSLNVLQLQKPLVPVVGASAPLLVSFFCIAQRRVAAAKEKIRGIGECEKKGVSYTTTQQQQLLLPIPNLQRWLKKGWMNGKSQYSSSMN